jgi:pyruvate/2-oxoglutarate dehydrogenase complex dihydrolipoamide acyltransferase (E2) component
MSENTAQNSSVATTTAQREYLDHATAQVGQGEPAGADPDVLLDVPVLNVGGINLEVRGLRAYVAVLAELADFVNLSVGVDARLDEVKLEMEEVKLEMEDVEAQALLKVRLEHVRAILESALRAVAENPHILQSLTRTVDRTAEQVGGAAQEAVGEGGAVSELGGGVSDATQSVGEATGRVTEDAQGTVGQVVGQGGESAQGAPGEAQEGEVKATPSAERLARELGVDLSKVEGTGTGGRITVRDVRGAAQ